jgi:hypothetical protein
MPIRRPSCKLQSCKRRKEEGLRARQRVHPGELSATRSARLVCQNVAAVTPSANQRSIQRRSGETLLSRSFRQVGCAPVTATKGSQQYRYTEFCEFVKVAGAKHPLSAHTERGPPAYHIRVSG